MKRILFSISAMLTLSAGFSQTDVVAVTGVSPNKIEAKNLQFLNSSTYRMQNELTSFENTPLTSKGIAALSYNKDQTQLVYMDLSQQNIYAYDLRSGMTTTIQKGDELAHCSLGMQFARMTLAPNGNIYAINNNATSVLEISEKNGVYTVKDLGYLTDTSTSEKSLLDRYVGWGGDMVADANGTLYIISARAKVFSVDLKNMTSSYIGTIENLENGFTTNGAAVDKNGNVLVANSQGKGVYSFNINDLKAQKASQDLPAVYDLASPYFLNNKLSQLSANSQLSLYPTKVKDRQITLSSLNTKLSGKGKVIVLDVNGQVMFEKDIVFNQTNKDISLRTLPNVGYYIVKVLDKNDNEIHNEKIIVLR